MYLYGASWNRTMMGLGGRGGVTFHNYLNVLFQCYRLNNNTHVLIIIILQLKRKIIACPMSIVQ